MFKNCCVLFSLTLIFSQITYTSSDIIDGIDKFIAQFLAGVELTTLYTLSLGTNYPPIDQDVTFWCVLPNKTFLNQTFFNDPNIKQKIDFSRPVNFVIHGWLGGINGGNIYLPAEVRASSGWMQSTSINWAHYANCNVCSIDWSRLANYDYSVAAMKHTKMVAESMVYFLKFLIKNGMSVRKVSIAGHSLGAQVAAFVGQAFNGVLYAIYGLDPAGPGFTCPFDFGKNTRLDPTDARYVQCVLTSRGTLGTMKDCGHGNFIMNGGFMQPGCYSVLCSHSRAHDFFEKSLIPAFRFIGEHCTGSIKFFVTKTFLRRPCSVVTDKLGIYSNRTKGRFFIKTQPMSPYTRDIETQH